MMDKFYNSKIGTTAETIPLLALCHDDSTCLDFQTPGLRGAAIQNLALTTDMATHGKYTHKSLLLVIGGMIGDHLDQTFPDQNSDTSPNLIAKFRAVVNGMPTNDDDSEDDSDDDE
jgi:hypothetical protein